MPLTASSPVIFIAPGDANGAVTISWEYDPAWDIRLEQRLYKVGSPTPVFQPRAIPSTQSTKGSYSQILTPGDAYEVRSFNRNFIGSGQSDAEKARSMLDEVAVHALRTSFPLQSDFNEKVGGTFYRYDIATGSTLTHAIMEIGKDQPTVSLTGFRTMANPTITVKSFNSATFHELTTDRVDLDDESTLTDSRFALIRVSDAGGNWEQVERPVRTLNRKLTIDFQQIDVQSLGEPASETDADMRFSLEVWDRDGTGWKPFQTFSFEKHGVTLTPFSVRDFVPNPVAVIGPRPVRDQTAGLKLHVREFDPSPFEDEEAVGGDLFGHHPKAIRVQRGEFEENQTLNLSVRAFQAKVANDPLDPEEAVDVVVHVAVTVEHG